MNEEQIAAIWLLLKEYIDESLVSEVGERYIDLLVDVGVNDNALKHSIGHDASLDEAIEYYLDDDEESDWD